ncbi:hypothetical protein P7C70_g6251, partial [Phenoliferia sp. Uapishka_3]
MAPGKPTSPAEPITASLAVAASGGSSSELPIRKSAMNDNAPNKGASTKVTSPALASHVGPAPVAPVDTGVGTRDDLGSDIESTPSTLGFNRHSGVGVKIVGNDTQIKKYLKVKTFEGEVNLEGYRQLNNEQNIYRILEEHFATCGTCGTGRRHPALPAQTSAAPLSLLFHLPHSSALIPSPLMEGDELPRRRRYFSPASPDSNPRPSTFSPDRPTQARQERRPTFEPDANPERPARRRRFEPASPDANQPAPTVSAGRRHNHIRSRSRPSSSALSDPVTPPPLPLLAFPLPVEGPAFAVAPFQPLLAALPPPQQLAPQSAPVDSAEYSRLLFAHGHGLFLERIDRRRWVVEDFRDGEMKVGIFYHLTADSQNDHTCDCPEAQKPNAPKCRHRILLEHSWELFNAIPALSSIDNPPAIEIAAGAYGWLSWLSVRSGQEANAVDGKRTIVRHHSGHFFSCLACRHGNQPPTACRHRRRAKDFLVGTLGREVEGELDVGIIDELVQMGRYFSLCNASIKFQFFVSFLLDELEMLRSDAVIRDAGRRDVKPTSYLPIAPPQWFRLPSDTIPHRYTPPHLFPAIFRLPVNRTLARCACGNTGAAGKNEKVCPCRVYTTHGVLKLSIEAQRCTCHPHGEQHTIGPDLGEYGLFNWDLNIIVSHELFNDYSAQLINSPTPLNSFQRTCNARYAECHSPHPMLPKSTFNLIFYAFAKAQFTEPIFACPVCGSEPEDVIADGVHTSFHSRHRLDTLRPPTVPDSQQPCTDVKPPRDTPFLSTAHLRKTVISAIKATRRSLEAHIGFAGGGAGVESRNPLDSDEESDEDADEDVLSWEHLVEAEEALRANTGRPRKPGRRRRRRGGLGVDATAEAPRNGTKAPTPEAIALADVLRELNLSSKDVNSHLTLLLLDLAVQVSAHESTLQLCRPHLAPLVATALLPRGEFTTAESPERLAARRSLQKHAPAIGALLDYLEQHEQLPSPSTTVLLLLIARKSIDIFVTLQGEHTSAPPAPPSPSADPFLTGVCYGAPKCRSRPFYSKFKETGSAGIDGGRWGRSRVTKESKETKSSEADGLPDCQKFYKEYSEARLTGGIMGLWCKHAICVGFHVIPRAEGRNDVFSAIFTRWKIAPRTLVYDFACALAPYCLSREPAYWAKTLFVIDQLHQHDHTKCSKSCFLSTYMEHDVNLTAINSSAAECGNAGLARIRKTLSYCTQEHAVLLVRHFLNLWNRKRIRGD